MATKTSYFDSSALVKRYLAEVGSVWVQSLCNTPDHVIALSDLGRVEIAAAFASKLRSRTITQTDYHKAYNKFFADVQQTYQLLLVSSPRIDEAILLTAPYKLRGYDAVHLASALYLNQVLVNNGLDPLTFISADKNLLEAARFQGLLIENPNLYP